MLFYQALLFVSLWLNSGNVKNGLVYRIMLIYNYINQGALRAGGDENRKRTAGAYREIVKWIRGARCLWMSDWAVYCKAPSRNG